MGTRVKWTGSFLKNKTLMMGVDMKWAGLKSTYKGGDVVKMPQKIKLTSYNFNSCCYQLRCLI